MSGVVVVLGASGQIGRFVLPRLARAGRPVFAVGRHGAPAGYPDLDGVTWIGMERLGSAAGAATAMVSAGPIDLSVRAMNDLEGLERVVCFSTTSVATKRGSADPAERATVDAIVRAEGELASRCDAKEIALALLRPTLIYGCGLDENVTRIARWVRRRGVVPVAGRARGLRQPVHCDDLAATAVAVVLGEAPARLSCALPGGETLSYREMVERVFAGLGRRPRIWSLPPSVLAAAVTVARRWPGLEGLNAEMVRRQARDLVFDGTAARERLGHAPRAFHPGAADFEPPGAQRILTLAGQA